MGCGVGREDSGAGEEVKGMSGPPQIAVIRIRAVKACFAVGKSAISFAKCSTADITVSKAG